MPKNVGCRKILLVDDASTIAETWAMILSQQGYKARVASSAEEAIELIATWQPDLAFVDVMLPGMNGIEFSKVLRANHPSCEVRLVSGHPGAAELAAISSNQGQPLSILPKPLDPRTILAIAAQQAADPAQAADA